jgi:hypothetical protein
MPPRTQRLLGVALATLLLAGCGLSVQIGTPPTPTPLPTATPVVWPRTFEQQFMSGCGGGATCQCELRYLEAHETPAQAIELAFQLQRGGGVPPVLIDAVVACAA